MPTKPAKSWRDFLPIHPAAERFPLMSPDELRVLAEDIKQNGLRIPCCIVEDKDGREVLFDGRNRLDALELIGEKITLGTLNNSNIFERIEAEYIDISERVVSLNIHRRHLTGEQKRGIIAELIKAQPEKPDLQIAKTIKVSPTTVGTVRREMEAKGDVSKLETRTDTQGRKQRSSKPRKAKRSKVAASPPPPTADAQTIRDAAATRIRALRSPQISPPPSSPRDDIGTSQSEAARLQVCVETLQAEKCRLELKVAALEREIEELRGKLATATGGDMSINEFQTAIKKWEGTVETQRSIIARLEKENAKLRATSPLDDGLDIPEELRRAAS